MLAHYRGQGHSSGRMPGLPVIPEIDHMGYEAYVRQVTKRRKRQSLPLEKRNLNTMVSHSQKSVNHSSPDAKPSRETKLDYHGLNNSMKKLTVRKTRKWRTKEPGSPKLAWQSTLEKDNKQHEKKCDGEEDDKASVMSVDRHIIRKKRSSQFAKFKYPEKFHYGFRSQQTQLEENIPQCLRQYPRYSNQPVRQNCKYDPIHSVTHLHVHCIRSCTLPHPGTSTKKRRPTSAPPGSMTTYNNVNSTYYKDNLYYKANTPSEYSIIRSEADQTHSKKATEELDQSLERNGSFQFVYDDESTHVTLAVEDSDDERDDERDGHVPSRDTIVNPPRRQSSEDSKYSNNHNKAGRVSHEPEEDDARHIYSEAEELVIKDETRRYSDAEEVASLSGTESYPGYKYSLKDSESAKSVDSEPDYF